MKWITEPYTVQEDTVMKGVEPQQSAFTGEIICDTVFWNQVSNDIEWYTLMCKMKGLVMIRLKQILTTGVTMKMINDNNMLQNKMQQETGNTPRSDEDR